MVFPMQRKFIYVYLILVFLLPSAKSFAQYQMHFFLPDFPPYTTIDTDGNPRGIGLDKMKQVLDSMEIEYTIQVGSNHGRALSELKVGRSDGFFMASKNEQRDRYAVFSESVMVNRWVWVVLKHNKDSFNPSPEAGYEIESLLNTNTHYWLKKSGYAAAKPAYDITSLVEKLDTQEADAILVAEEVFNSRFGQDERYQVILQQEKKFGAYISKAFLSQNPTFMTELNQAILANR